MVKAAAVVTGDGSELQSLIDGLFFGCLLYTSDAADE